MTEATVENGCLQVLPKKSSGRYSSFIATGDQIGIPEKLIEQELVKPVPLNPGGVLFFPSHVQTCLAG